MIHNKEATRMRTNHMRSRSIVRGILKALKASALRVTISCGAFHYRLCAGESEPREDSGEQAGEQQKVVEGTES
jgi:hypothetical protein